MAVASAGPYANNLHLTPVWQPHQHLITEFWQAGSSSWCQTQQCRSTECTRYLINQGNWLINSTSYKHKLIITKVYAGYWVLTVSILWNVVNAELFHVRLKLVDRVFVLVVYRPPVVILTHKRTIIINSDGECWQEQPTSGLSADGFRVGSHLAPSLHPWPI